MSTSPAPWPFAVNAILLIRAQPILQNLLHTIERAPHRSSVRRVSTVAASGGIFMRRLLVGMIMKIV